MLSTLRHRLVALTAALATAVGLSLSLATPAQAIIGGTVDTTNTYPNVGVIVSYNQSGRSLCSGTLVTPTVVLTAGHCTSGIFGKSLVNFKPLISDENHPTALPQPVDPSAGFVGTEGATQGFISGTAVPYPGFVFDISPTSLDLGVIVLDTPVTGIAPASLAPLGYLDRLAQPTLTKTLFTVVGYGSYLGQAANGGNKPVVELKTIQRASALVQASKLTRVNLMLQGNPNDKTGTGTFCFGDSGGPGFAPSGYLVAVNSYVRAGDCRWMSAGQRTDLANGLEWLATFGVSPSAE